MYVYVFGICNLIIFKMKIGNVNKRIWFGLGVEENDDFY